MPEKWKIRVHPLRNSIITQSMVFFIIIFALPMALFYQFLSQASSRQAIADAGAQYKVVLQNVSDTMDEVFYSINILQTQLRADSVLSGSAFSSELIGGKDNYTAYQIIQAISRTLYQAYLSSSYIHSIELYHPYADIMFSSQPYATRKIVTQPSEDDISWLSEAAEATSHTWQPEIDENGAMYLVSYFCPYFSNDPSAKLFCRITLSSDILSKRFRALAPDKTVGLFVKSDAYVLAVPGVEGARGIDALAELPPGSWRVLSNGSDEYLAVAFQSSYTTLCYFLSAPLSSLSSSTGIIQRYSYYFFFCLLLIFVAVLVFLLHRILRPIHVLCGTIQTAESGDLSVRVPVSRPDEFGMIGNQFNVLLESIEQLIHENYETRVLKNEFELKYIQNQLNEHFLFNTLDSIHWIANSHHVPQISEIIFNLSRLFRLTLNEGRDTLAVSQAAEILKAYIMLINVRMDGAILSEIEVDPKIKDCRTYKYFFQPIVENAYQHGLRPQLGGRLKIAFREEPAGWLCYTVTDNGVGMSPEKLAVLMEDIKNPDDPARDSGRNFAIKNIVRQLRLYYRDEYRFSITSSTGQGTTVRLAFPLKAEDAHE